MTITDAVGAWVAGCKALAGVEWALAFGGEVPCGQDMGGNRLWCVEAVLLLKLPGATDAQRHAGQALCEAVCRWVHSHARGGFALPPGCDFVDVVAQKATLSEREKSGLYSRYGIDIGVTFERGV